MRILYVLVMEEMKENHCHNVTLSLFLWENVQNKNVYFTKIYSKTFYV